MLSGWSGGMFCSKTLWAVKFLTGNRAVCDGQWMLRVSSLQLHAVTFVALWLCYRYPVSDGKAMSLRTWTEIVASSSGDGFIIFGALAGNKRMQVVVHQVSGASSLPLLSLLSLV